MGIVILIPILDSSSCDLLASSCPIFPPFNFDPSLLNLDPKLCHLVWCFVSFVRWFVGFLGLFLLREKLDDLCFYLCWIQWLLYKPNALVSILSTCFTRSSQSNCHDFFFAWFFQNCKCMLTWFDFWFWKRQISWVQFTHKCLDFLMKFDFHLFVQPSQK